ncbi:DUF4304 domain-containing protein [Paracrocinitomix mangrovi]|uniref:DUF4304 domain-containing protein n=1 Tax=Paracrocinitomix mangrovi TaxID=2862509 RepID=UPI001C8D80E2|nr:DUF4304 domain-containing protein [Paracrocinitomix mangrovi]UKN00203.1 DUF4304 domain-containing protein [Paracrocinitomix mangrovi]
MNTQDFKKQIGKYLGAEMRSLGFTGSGFDYRKESGDYILLVSLHGDRFGGGFWGEFGLHFKDLDSEFYKDPKKINVFNVWIRDRLRGRKNSPKRWNYMQTEEENKTQIDDFIQALTTQVIPLFQKLENGKEFFSDFPTGLFASTKVKIVSGFSCAMAPSYRIAYLGALFYEKRDPKKAKKFLKYVKSRISPEEFPEIRNDISRLEKVL